MLNLRALNFSPRNEIHILQYMSKKIGVLGYDIDGIGYKLYLPNLYVFIAVKCLLVWWVGLS